MSSSSISLEHLAQDQHILAILRSVRGLLRADDVLQRGDIERRAKDLELYGGANQVVVARSPTWNKRHVEPPCRGDEVPEVRTLEHGRTTIERETLGHRFGVDAGFQLPQRSREASHVV